MQTKDVLVKSESGQSEVQSRADAASPFLQADAWKSLASRMDIKFNSFPSDGTKDGTDLFAALSNTIESSQRILGVVLISDGDWNSGQSPVSAAMRYRAQGIPIISIPVGASTRLPDVELLSVDTPTFGITNKAVRIPFTIESALPRDYVANVVVTSSDGERINKEVRITAMSRTSDSVVWTPKSDGDFTLTVDVPQHPDELITSNNSISTPFGRND